MFSRTHQHCNRLCKKLKQFSRTTSNSVTIQQHGFHSTLINCAKKHPKQIKKENLAKRAHRLAEFERTKPSPIISRHAPFFSTLQTPASAYNNTTGRPLYQHFLNPQDQCQFFEQTPKDNVEQSHLAAAMGGMDDALAHEQHKVDTLKKMIGLQNGNAKAVQLWNVHQAIDWFKKREGDTGSPEVQAAILTVRIHNLNSHLQQHKKDKHNYRQLRLMVYQRAKLLKYLKSKDASRYHTCLDGLGLEPRAVEGEITL